MVLQCGAGTRGTRCLRGLSVHVPRCFKGWAKPTALPTRGHCCLPTRGAGVASHIHPEGLGCRGLLDSPLHSGAGSLRPCGSRNGCGLAWLPPRAGSDPRPSMQLYKPAPWPLTHRDSAGRWQEGPTRSVHRQPEARQEEAPWTREASVVRAETRAPHSRGGIPPQTASHQERPGPTRAACGQHQDHQGAYALGGGDGRHLTEL